MQIYIKGNNTYKKTKDGWWCRFDNLTTHRYKPQFHRILDCDVPYVRYFLGLSNNPAYKIQPVAAQYPIN